MRRCLIPDLETELTAVLVRTEETLIAVSWWEADGTDLPRPLADQEALRAVRRLWDALAPSQGHGSRSFRLLAPNGRYEHLPLHVTIVDEDAIRVLREVVVALRHAVRVGEPFADAVTEQADCGEDTDTVVTDMARLQRLLELDWTRDAALLTDQITAGTGQDIVLDAEGECAYRRTARRLNGAWTGNATLDAFLY